jgi:tripartite-type tricarboxylate transporter receptor subunit TctC
MSRTMRRSLLVLGGLTAILAGAARADTHDFYKGKTLRIVVGFAAGGGFDTYTRTIARHMGNHIPGRPSIVVENMTGAGGLIAANHVYKVAKPDGLTMANFSGGLVSQQLLKTPGIEFDARRFEWVGVPVKDNVVCALTRASGVGSVEAWKGAKTPVKLGATGPGANTYDTPKVLAAALGLPIHVVAGYRGTAEIRLAADSGEIAGGCWAWESIKATWRKGLETGDVRIVLQAVAKPHGELPQVPIASTLATTDEARQLIEAGIYDPSAITRLYTLPPGTPKARVQLLRKAFLDTLQDPEFRAEATKAKLDVDPIPGEEVEAIVARTLERSPAVVARLKEVLATK